MPKASHASLRGSVWNAAKKPTPPIARTGAFSLSNTGIPAPIDLSRIFFALGNQKFASATS
jgi:hypothetical protein